MGAMTNLKKAMEIRKSSRAYLHQSVDPDQLERLVSLAAELSDASGLRLVVVADDPDAFHGFRKSYGLFTGVRNYLVLAGNPQSPDFLEKAGYYGERWVLEATSLGLGTCWAGGSFDRKSLHVELKPDEDIALLVVFGVTGETQSLRARLIRKAIHRKGKGVEQLLNASDQPPNWVLEGMKYVAIAPSAAHRQPVRFSCSGDQVMASVPGRFPMEWVDLGIAKFHFEAAAGPGKWAWGNNGRFERSL